MISRFAAMAFCLAVLSPTLALAGHPMAEGIKTAPVGGSEALITSNGMTLYTFDKDGDGKSNCYGKCAKNWPPMAATASSKTEGDFSVVKRKDGTFQWAYKGMPLYTWFKDMKAGDNTGDGVKGVWHTARP